MLITRSWQLPSSDSGVFESQNSLPLDEMDLGMVNDLAALKLPKNPDQPFLNLEEIYQASADAKAYVNDLKKLSMNPQERREKSVKKALSVLESITALASLPEVRNVSGIQRFCATYCGSMALLIADHLPLGTDSSGVWSGSQITDALVKLKWYQFAREEYEKAVKITKFVLSNIQGEKHVALRTFQSRQYSYLGHAFRGMTLSIEPLLYDLQRSLKAERIEEVETGLQGLLSLPIIEVPQNVSVYFKAAFTLVKDLEWGTKSKKDAIADAVSNIGMGQSLFMQNLMNSVVSNFKKSLRVMEGLVSEGSGITPPEGFLVKQCLNLARAVSCLIDYDWRWKKESLCQEAIGYYQKAAEYCQQDNNESQLASAYGGMARVFFRAGDFDQAYPACIKAISYAEGEPTSLSFHHGYAGKIEMERRNWESAYTHFQTERRTLKSVLDLEDVPESILDLQEKICFATLRNYAAALKIRKSRLAAFPHDGEVLWANRARSLWGLLRVEVKRYRMMGGSSRVLTIVNRMVRDINLRDNPTRLRESF